MCECCTNDFNSLIIQEEEELEECLPGEYEGSSEDDDSGNHEEVRHVHVDYYVISLLNLN